jgi:predicted DNA-binding transcriptional regulator YafY
MPLNEVDIEAIRLAATTLSQFRSIDLFKSSEAAIDKILDRLSISPITGEKSTEAYVQFETAPVYKGSSHLPILLKAIREKVPVRFFYEKFTGGKQRAYELHPYLLKEYRNRWYVIGYNPDKKGVVIFGLDRIAESIQALEAPYITVPGFDPDIYFKHSLGITAVADAPQKVRLRFTPLTGKYVESQPLHHSQKILRNDEVALEVELNICITKELVMQILSYGADVEVKEPTSFRRQIQQALETSLKYYRS